MAATAVTAAVTVAVPPAGAVTSSAISAACGTALSGAEIATIVQLSGRSSMTSGDPLARYNAEVADDQRITSILVAHQDYRGLFAVGLDSAERGELQPFQQNAGHFAHPAFARKFSGALLRHWLDAVHAQFTGAVADPHWQRYFDLAHQCSASETLITLAGYDAHLNVDVAEGLADAGVTLADEPDYQKIVRVVEASSPTLIDATRSAYGVNLEPVWQVVLALAAPITGVAFANGLALRSPALAPAAKVELTALWRGTDAAFPALIALYGG